MFTCRIPDYLQKMPGRSFDSYAELYSGRGIKVVFDYGCYNSGLPNEVIGFKTHAEVIGGRSAKIAIRDNPREYPVWNDEIYYSAQVLFEDFGDGDNTLFLAVFFSKPDDLDAALMIIRSIEIP